MRKKRIKKRIIICNSGGGGSISIISIVCEIEIESDLSVLTVLIKCRNG